MLNTVSKSDMNFRLAHPRLGGSLMQAEGQQHATEERRTAVPPYPGAPRWVKVVGIIGIALVLLAAFLVFTGIGGPHGPGRHLSSDEATAYQQWRTGKKR